MNNTISLYILSALFLIWLFAFIAYLVTKKTQKKLIKNIRQNWAQPNINSANFDLIEHFSTLTTSCFFHQLTPQTIADIDLHNVFSFIDRTTSKPGQQFLFNKLIKPTDDIQGLENFNKQVNYFSENVAVRENTQLALTSLAHHDAYYIVNLLDNALLEKPKWSVWYIIDTVAVILMLLLSIKFHVLLIWLMIPLAVNIFLYFRGKNTTSKFSKSFQQLDNLITVSKLLTEKGFAL
ncbi:MAG: hypothetical protein WDM90_05355 [Ferruginibacter sp.]